MRQPASRDLDPDNPRDFGQQVVDASFELVTNGSIELTSSNANHIQQAAELLPFGFNVFVPRHRNQTLDANLTVLKSIHECGLNPVPHLAARTIESRKELTSYLNKAVTDCGVDQVLVIGGDQRKPLGPFPDSAAVLRDGVLTDCGIREVGVSGYPEGHPIIPLNILEADFATKLELATSQNLGLHVVTQFSFAPNRIVEFCSSLQRTAPKIPVYVGLAGPTSAARLLKYAQMCGVSSSLRALSSMGLKAVKLTSHTDPGEQLTVLARHCTGAHGCNIIGVHLFSFGGFLQSAQWIREKVRHP
jgi:methylenetetrahydrofolate reductase (NADPH)